MESVDKIREATTSPQQVLHHEAAARLLREIVETDEPFVAGKLGSTECILIAHALQGRKIPEQLKAPVDTLAGIYPFEPNSLRSYCQRVLDLLPHVDMICPWNTGKNRGEELILPGYARKDVKYAHLRSLDPLYQMTPWTLGLEGKKVLVISPFADSIRSQYERRDEWNTTGYLPDLEQLETIKTRFSAAANGEDGFKNWYNEYIRVLDTARTKKFDTALIGCGGISLPLACEIKKEMGRQAIHTGGATQMIFGVLGGRWSEREDIQYHFNDNWVYPSDEETPKNVQEMNRCDGGPTYFKPNRD